MKPLMLLLALASVSLGFSDPPREGPSPSAEHSPTAASWPRAIPMLKREGYTVIAFQNPLTHLSEDIAATKRVIDAQNAPILVVGNSYGGAVITAAAARLVDLWTGAHDAQVGRVRRSPDQPNQRPRDRREADDLKLIASLLIRPG